jgi:hypothetical protein
VQKDEGEEIKIGTVQEKMRLWELEAFIISLAISRGKRLNSQGVVRKDPDTDSKATVHQAKGKQKYGHSQGRNTNPTTQIRNEKATTVNITARTVCPTWDDYTPQSPVTATIWNPSSRQIAVVAADRAALHPQMKPAP